MIKMNWKKAGIVLLSLFVISQIIGSFFFYELAIKRGPKPFLENNADLQVADDSMDLYLNGDWIDWVRGQEFEDLTLTSHDGLLLSGYYLPASKPTNKVVILTHGYLGNAKQMGLFGQHYYTDLGYNLFMPDARGHGKSQGDYYGFGWQDRLDLIDWTTLLVDKFGTDTEIVYHGLSMGAATVLMASGEASLPKQVQAIVADSPYASVYQLFAYQMKRMFHLPAFPLLDSTSVLTKVRAGFSFREASTKKAVERATLPILYIHGEEDTFVPVEMAKDLRARTRTESEILLVPNANHGEAFAVAGETYLKKLDIFLEMHVR